MRRGLSVAYWGLVLAILLLAPLPLGCVNTEWKMSLTLLCLAAGVLGLLTGGRRGGVVLLPVAALVGLALFQLLPLPKAMVRLLSPERLRLPGVPGGDALLSLTVYRGGTLEELLLLFACTLLALSVIRRGGRVPFRLLAVAGGLHALFAFFLAGSGGTSSRQVVFIQSLPDVLTPFGTYVNKNHFAGFMLIGLGGGLAVLYGRIARSLEETTGLEARLRWPALFTNRRAFRLLLPSAGVLVMVLAVFASGSRGAALALAVAFAVVTIAAGKASGRVRLWPVFLGLLVLVGAGLAATKGRSVSVFERLEPQGRYLNRVRLWKNAVELTGKYPVFGTGLGSFPYIFPRYQSFDPSREFTHAEGDWIQYLVEAGLLGAACLAGFGYLVGRRLYFLLRGRRRVVPLAIGGGTGFLAIVLHGFVDSSLHIPANLAAFAVLIGAILSLPVRETAETAGEDTCAHS